MDKPAIYLKITCMPHTCAGKGILKLKSWLACQYAGAVIAVDVLYVNPETQSIEYGTSKVGWMFSISELESGK